MTREEVIAQERYEDLCEYFGESKDILKNRDDFKAWLDRVKWHIRKAEELYEKYERKTGKWIIIDDCEQFIAKCSECGRIEDSRMISKYPYCHCGARMESED